MVAGLHAVRPNGAAMPDTVRGLRDLGVETLVPDHCTGWPAPGACARLWDGNHLVPMAVGSGFAFA